MDVLLFIGTAEWKRAGNSTYLLYLMFSGITRFAGDFAPAGVPPGENRPAPAGKRGKKERHGVPFSAQLLSTAENRFHRPEK